MGELDELREEIEELREQVEELQEGESDDVGDDEEDESRTLYMYIEFVVETQEIMGMEMERKKVLLIEENNSYQVPNSVEAELASTTRQVIQYVKGLGIDCWNFIRRTAERENAVYYTVSIPERMASQVERGAWVEKAEASDLINEMEPREYL